MPGSAHSGEPQRSEVPALGLLSKLPRRVLISTEGSPDATAADNEAAASDDKSAQALSAALLEQIDDRPLLPDIWLAMERGA